MPERNVSIEDVLATLANPSYELLGNQLGTLDSYGTTADNRAFYVVTARNRTFVITVAVVKES